MSAKKATVDLNCDMGEGIGNDEEIMPFITSANVACGYHAGDEKTMADTIALAIKNGVAVGAHVSFADKNNFGRTEMNLPVNEIYDLVFRQLMIIKQVTDSFRIKMRHVKPHGALYNMSARDVAIAKTIATAIKDFDETLVVFGLSGSHSISEAKAIGLRTASEVFADRTYQDDGSLTPRSKANALIEEEAGAIRQVLRMIENGTVMTTSGKEIQITADTICIHGDGRHAIEFAKSIFHQLKQNNIALEAI